MRHWNLLTKSPSHSSSSAFATLGGPCLGAQRQPHRKLSALRNLRNLPDGWPACQQASCNVSKCSFWPHRTHPASFYRLQGCRQNKPGQRSKANAVPRKQPRTEVNVYSIYLQAETRKTQQTCFIHINESNSRKNKNLQISSGQSLWQRALSLWHPASAQS